MPTTLCRYWVRAEREPEFKALLAAHWPTFLRLGLVDPAGPHLVYRGEDKERGLFYVETFPWRDDAAVETAHEHPEVMAVWGPMGACCSSMEFPFVERIE